MSPFRRRAKFILRINGQLLLVFGCAFIGWFIWPQAPEWWGLGVMSIIFGAAALGELIKALKTIPPFIIRERTLIAYEAQGGRPKTARMASIDDLKKAGMLE